MKPIIQSLSNVDVSWKETASLFWQLDKQPAFGIAKELQLPLHSQVWGFFSLNLSYFTKQTIKFDFDKENRKVRWAFIWRGTDQP